MLDCCFDCEFLDYSKWGCYCMLLDPMPVWKDDHCDSFKLLGCRSQSDRGPMEMNSLPAKAGLDNK